MSVTYSLEEINQTRLKELVKSTGFIFSILYLSVIFWLINQSFLGISETFAFILLGLVAVLAEYLRFSFDQTKQHLVKFDAIIDRYLTLFVMAGYVLGMVNVAISIFFQDLISVKISYFSPILLSLILIFTSFVLGLSFYRITKEDAFTKTRGLLFSGNIEISYLLFFFYIYSLLPFVLFSFSLRDGFGTFSSMLDSKMIFSLTLPGIMILLIILFSDIGRNFLLFTQLRYPRQEKTKGIIVTILSTFLTLLIVIIFLLKSVTLLIFFIVSFLISWRVVSSLLSSHNASLCPTCNLQMMSGKKFDEYMVLENVLYCNNCDLDTPPIEFFGLVSRKTKAPKCPVCKNHWDQFTRRCKHCNFMILLSCPNCTETINPLWEECAKCHIELTPIPSLALDLKRGVGRSKQIIVLWFFTSVMAFNLLSEISLWFGLNSLPLDNPLVQDAEYIHATTIKIMIFGLSLTALFYINMKLISPYFVPIVELVSKLIFYPIMILILYSSTLLIYVSYQFFTSFLAFPPLLSFFFSGLFAIIAFYFWKREWFAFIDFRATLGHDPELILANSMEAKK